MSKRVYCVETKEVFSSAKAAAKAYNINPSSMSNHLKHKQGPLTKDKLHFRYYD